MGLFPCFVAYPLIYRRVVPVPGRTSRLRVLTGTTLAAVAALELGASGVVAETLLSGNSQLPLGAFALAMLPIHFAIGVVEGLVTGAVVFFALRENLPLYDTPVTTPGAGPRTGRVLAAFALATVVTGAALSWFASSHPDGLEWSLLRSAGTEELPPPPDGSHAALAKLQEKTAILPDYGFADAENDTEAQPASWPAVDPGTSVAGLVGSTLTLMLVVLMGLALRKRKSAAETA
jgi:cobalt/nickel transport system permease protein